MKRSAPFVIVGLVAILAIGSGVFLYTSKRAANPPLKIAKQTGEQAESAHILGPADAAVTLEEFGDFQCPPCGRLSEPINELQKKYNLRVIFRQFPLPMHKHARAAAYAAEAAGRQGRFWEMHDLLFREQAVWSNSTDAPALFQAYAGMLQLDLGRFKADMENPDVQRNVELDEKRGAMIGVKTTPTIFLNNDAVAPNDLLAENFAAAVEAAVKKAKPSP